MSAGKVCQVGENVDRPYLDSESYRNKMEDRADWL